MSATRHEMDNGRPPDLVQPLMHRGFTLIAAATLVSNVGVWMRDTTSAWTMAGHAHHHSAAALVQAATTFPVFLLALPAGVLADHYDRRRLLIACQAALAAVGCALAALAGADALTPGRMVLLALAAGSAAALAAPAWQAIVPSLVRREEIPSAVAVSSIGFNIARILGPAIGSILGGVVLSIAHSRRIDDEMLLAACTAAGAFALLLLPQATEAWTACLALAIAGGATLIQLATYNAATQLIVPEAIRGRGLAIYMAVTFGTVAVGSLAWDSISDVFSIGAALLLSAIGFLLAGVAGRWAVLPIPAIAGAAS